MKPLVGVYYHDPGGEAALAPVLDTLARDGRVYLAIGKTQERPALVLTATSLEGPEREAIVQAHLDGVPSLSVLDFWSNYRLRFENGNGLVLPDKIAVMDYLAVREMKAEGFPESRLVITGQPAFDCLAERRKDFNERHAYWTRKYYGFREGRKTVVFASQPLAAQPYDYGFNEHTVLPLVIQAVNELGVDLIIRPHPREYIGDLECYASPNVRILRRGLVHELLMSADLVVGMNSELLVEACYLGCNVLSVQPGMRGVDHLPTNRIGISKAVYCAKDLAKTMGEILFRGISLRYWKEKRDRWIYQKPAAPKVAALVYQMIGVKNAEPGY